jgi:hypothetical protein
VLQKQMKAERRVPRTAGSPRGQLAWVLGTLRGTLLLRMATPVDSRKANGVVIRKAPCLHPKIPRARARGFFAKDISIVKKLKERALSLTGKLPAPNKSLDLCSEIWERESAPAN